MELTVVCTHASIEPGIGHAVKVTLQGVETERLRRYLPALKEQFGASALAAQFTPYEYAGTLNAADREALYVHLKADFEEGDYDE